MKEIEKLINNIYKWYSGYENKAISNEKIKINILYEMNTIDISVTEECQLLDKLYISFNEKDNDIYNYVVMVLFKKIFNKVFIHSTDNSFYNNKHRPYLNFLINDNYLKCLASIIKMSQKEDPNLENDLITKELYGGIYQKKLNEELPFEVDTHTTQFKKLIRKDLK